MCLSGQGCPSEDCFGPLIATTVELQQQLLHQQGAQHWTGLLPTCLPTARQQLMQRRSQQHKLDVCCCLRWQAGIALATAQPTLKLTSSWSSRGHNSARRTSSSASGGRPAPAAMALAAHCWSVPLVAWRGCSHVHRHSCRQGRARLSVPWPSLTTAQGCTQGGGWTLCGCGVCGLTMPSTPERQGHAGHVRLVTGADTDSNASLAHR